MLLLFFFFFQAEDGIRDLYVTGVQTCALPISIGYTGWRNTHRERRDRAAGDAEIPGDRALGDHGRYHRSRRTGESALASRQADLNWTAGGWRGARSQYAAGGDFFLHADAGKATPRRSAKIGIVGQDHPADVPRIRNSK